MLKLSMHIPERLDGEFRKVSDLYCNVDTVEFEKCNFV